MNFLNQVLSNEIFMAAIISWFAAQLLKTIIHVIINKKFVVERLVGSGGMPSSHSSTVCALATATAIHYNASSFEFAMAFVFAIIVMYDAIGVRRETGIQAKVLNELIELIAAMGKPMSAQEKLKEFVGHTPPQVFAGAILGIVIALVVCS